MDRGEITFAAGFQCPCCGVRGMERVASRIYRCQLTGRRFRFSLSARAGIVLSPLSEAIARELSRLMDEPSIPTGKDAPIAPALQLVPQEGR